MSREIWAVDCETDPFEHGRFPEPFMWGAYNGKDFYQFEDTDNFVNYFKNKNCILYAHNGGKFDFLFLLPFIDDSTALIINSRIVQCYLGKSQLRDSYAILPLPLADYQKTAIEYWKFEADVRMDHLDEIIAYLENDCKDLYQLVSRYRDAAGSRPTIAGNALNHAKQLGLDPGRTSHKFDTIFRPYYFGGRTEVFQAGKFHNINVFDIKSAYPYAMIQSHATGKDYVCDDSLERYDDPPIARAFIQLTCFSAGAFPVSDGVGLRFPHALREYFVTGWEYLAAKKHNLIRGERVHKITMFNKKISFENYVTHWFNHKENATDKAQRIIGKIMLKSLYGKLAQNPVKYKDYRIKSGGSFSLDDHLEGRQLDAVYGYTEIHARNVLHRLQEKHGDAWENFPIHYNVATGASITGFCRAQLLDAIHTVGSQRVIYCDTDSMMIHPDAQTHLLRQDNKIGAWEWEGLAGPCYITGKKQYALRFINGPNIGKEKIVCKGARLKMSDFPKLVRGEAIKWKNAAPTFSIASGRSFQVRSIRATAQISK